MKKIIIAMIFIVSFISQRTHAQETGSFTDSRDGKVYKTVKIGDRWWMAENLNYKTSSGSWIYDDDSTNAPIYGRLYDWETAKQACPSGWHLPNDKDWTTLENTLTEVDKGSQLCGNTSLWEDGNLKSSMVFGTSGFLGLPGGARYDDGHFGSMGYGCTWWGSTETKAGHARTRYLNYNHTVFFQNNEDRQNGFSVRCVRD